MCNTLVINGGQFKQGIIVKYVRFVFENGVQLLASCFFTKNIDLLEDKRNTFIFNEILWSKFLQQRTLITVIAESSQVSSRSRWLGQS